MPSPLMPSVPMPSAPMNRGPIDQMPSRKPESVVLMIGSTDELLTDPMPGRSSWKDS